MEAADQHDRGGNNDDDDDDQQYYAAGERSSLWHVGTLAGTQSTQGSEARVETLLESTSNLLA